MDKISLRRLLNCNLLIKSNLQFGTKCDEFLDVMISMIIKMLFLSVSTIY